ncbi:MAG TPA: hypothetical protein VK255_03050, partial [Patescibacteria group bacterium]|nr:hypothetical protein [Patescibacteria group bacterium]
MVWLKTKDFFLLHETKIILLLGFILVAILSFEAGLLKGKNITQNPVVVNAASCQNSDIALAEAPEGQNQPQERSDAQTG